MGARVGAAPVPTPPQAPEESVWRRRLAACGGAGRGDGDEAGEGADVKREAVLGRAVELDRRLRVRPRPVEQLDHPVMKNVDEPL